MVYWLRSLASFIPDDRMQIDTFGNTGAKMTDGFS